ncbi:2Fe-2S iron-sulfur cluster-binding protein [Aliivibrio kagoshimensis]|jgi:ferredoxin|uniref:2Fe-2S iron-sulfur cluster-binding protein n=1 Tax=Aliivibrio kagoshimensis TaxID=2910230 RepID=UPI003D0CFC23
MYQVRLLPEDVVFTVPRETSILQAALEQNIAFPNRCQVGACGMCLCKKLEGEVTYQLEPMLTEKEQREGWIFTCQAYAISDIVLLLD